MKVLVIGGGGREHALAWKLAQSPRVTAVQCAPGNAGMAQLTTCHDVASTDILGLVQLATREQIDLTVVGPEAPLAAGIADAFAREGLRIFGPSRRAAQLEASKAFAKTFMQQHGIPTAHYGVFTVAAEAKAFARREALPLVIKADGLAAGKGVVITRDWPTVEQTIDAMLSGVAHGEAGQRIVIEQFLAGEELSCIAIVDGEHYLLLDAVRDHKRLCDGDTGPNTGGMGAYTPTGLWTPMLETAIRRRIIEPTIAGLAAEGRRFVGFLYAGLMIVDGEPYVLEYNVRLGDPEAQALLFRLRSDVAPLLMQAAEGNLTTPHLLWDERTSVCVVMAAAGYPEAPQAGAVITGLEGVTRMSEVMVFHAGTRQRDGAWLTHGGRVLGVTALGENLTAAHERAYAAVGRLQWDGVQYRGDIGGREMGKRKEVI